MLALAAADAVSVVLFGVLYAVAGARVLSQAAFLVCLPVLFVLMTAVWVRTEARHRRLALLDRLGRIVGGLAIVGVTTPVAVLGPLFWLDERVPLEAGLHGARGGVMALVLIALVLVVLVNVAGAVAAMLRPVLGRRRTPDRTPGR